MKNSEGNYTLGRGNEWSVNNTVTSVQELPKGKTKIYEVELNNGEITGYTLKNKAGRKGNIATRTQNQQIAEHLQNNGWEITGGGNMMKEEYLRGANGTKGSNYIDITDRKLLMEKRLTIRINTVDTYKRTGNMTNREAKVAEAINIKIRKMGKDPELITIPKGKQLGDLDKELLKIEQTKFVK